LKAFQREWNAVGLVPIKKKDEVNARFKQVIDAQFAKLKSSDRPRGTYQPKTQYGSKAVSDKGGDPERRSLLNRISELKNDVSDCDALVVCTGSTEVVVTKDLFNKLCISNKQRTVIDLALPSNVDTEISTLEECEFHRYARRSKRSSKEYFLQRRSFERLHRNYRKRKG